jgi:hypothetical protein
MASSSSDFGKVNKIGSLILKVSERLTGLAKVDNGQLIVDLLSGAVTVYHDSRYDKEQLENAINENLEQLRQKYPR